MNREEIGIKIKLERNNLNLSQQGLADSLNPVVGIKTIQRAEKGDSKVSGETLMNICKYLDIIITTDDKEIIYEIESLTSLIQDNKNIETICGGRDSFNKEELDLIISFLEIIERPYNSFKEELEIERDCFEIIKNMTKKSIKIFTRIKKDVILEFEETYPNPYDPEECFLETHKINDDKLLIYFHKINSKNVYKNKQNKYYLKIVNDNFKNLINQREEMGINIYDYESQYMSKYTPLNTFLTPKEIELIELKEEEFPF